MTNVITSNVETLEKIEFHGGKHVCKMIEARKDGKETSVSGYKCESASISKCVCN